MIRRNFLKLVGATVIGALIPSELLVSDIVEEEYFLYGYNGRWWSCLSQGSKDYLQAIFRIFDAKDDWVHLLIGRNPIMVSNRTLRLDVEMVIDHPRRAGVIENT